MPAFGQILRRGFKGVTKNDTLKLLDNLAKFSRCPQQLRHIMQVHAAMLSNGDCKRLAGRIHTGNGTLRANRAPGKHLRFGFQPSVLVDILQRTEQIIGGILCERLCIGAGIYRPVFLIERIVGGI